MTTKMTIAASLSLYNMLEAMLFEKMTDEEGKEKIEERNLPFNVKFKIQANLNTLAKDYAHFEAETRKLFETYGVEKENNVLEIPEDKRDEFSEARAKIFAEHTENEMVLFTLEDIDAIKVEGFTVQQIDLFIDALLKKDNFPTEEEFNEGLKLADNADTDASKGK